MAHLELAQFNEVLSQLHPGAEFDARGTTIKKELLEPILNAVKGDDGVPEFGVISFAHATFSYAPEFEQVRFNGSANFEHAQFKHGANFEKAQFKGDTTFEQADFRLGAAEFNDAHFNGRAAFNSVSSITSAYYRRAYFAGYIDFDNFDATDRIYFTEAQFGKAELLGPLQAYQIDLSWVIFDHRILIEANAANVSFRGATWREGGTLRLRTALIDLERATFAAPLLVTGHSEPIRHQRYEDRVRDSLIRHPPGFEEPRPDSEHILQTFPLITGDRPPGREWMPLLRSLKGADADNLSLSDVDLSTCLLAGARGLDKIRLEGFCIFDRPPRGLRCGWAWPPVWWWSSRQTLAEERSWRATTRKEVGWRNKDFRETEVFPERLAVLYRQLRKAQEDAKNEPGAADFYYGEMEMRRRAKATPFPERLILTAYWSISGYGLRATRALISLGSFIVVSAAVLEHVGFAYKSPGYLGCLLYAAGSILSLNLPVQDLPNILTPWGAIIRILLRIAGPVFLALAVLALRSRVKR